MDLTSEIISIDQFPEVSVPNDHIAEPFLRNPDQPMRKNTVIQLMWVEPNGSFSLRRIFTYRQAPHVSG